MAKIIYGVSGEGSGHSTRASVVAEHLLQQGHRVYLASYDRGYRNLSPHFQVLEIEGLTIGSENNRVSLRKTLQSNFLRLAAASQKLEQLRSLFNSIEPEAVLTDFEPMTAYLAHYYHLPLISLDNQHRMRYLKAPIPPGLESEARLTRAVIRAITPKPDVCLVTTFVRGVPRHDRVFQFSPIVDPRVAVISAEATRSPTAHVLVYVTSGFTTLLESLRQLPNELFKVYGCPALTDGSCGNWPAHMQICPPSRDGFLHDLAHCKAVIATAGFTLISEALCLHKPYLAYPMQGQYEQQLNAYQLEDSSWGRRGRTAAPQEIEHFLGELPIIEEALAVYPSCDNRELLMKLDELLKNNAALARDYRRKRKAGVFS